MGWLFPSNSFIQAGTSSAAKLERFHQFRTGSKWVKQIKAPVQVICESSGGYERALVQGLARARVKISLVQANRVRQFARVAGILAKTHRIDAELLCSFCNVMRPQTVTAAKLEQEHLRELESQRRHLTHLLVMELNRGAPCQRCFRAKIESQFDQPNQKADRRVTRTLGQSSQTDL